MNIREIWRRVTATRYTRELEAEVTRQRADVDRQRLEIDRLRGENRALLNSILGIAGVPPITVPLESLSDSARAPELAAAAQRERREAAPGEAPSGSGQAPVASAAKRPHPQRRIGAAPGTNIVAPMRRRSWHQIYRMLELDSAKKEVRE